MEPVDTLLAAPAPFLRYIGESEAPREALVFIGNAEAAREPELLASHDIAAVLNVAVNVDAHTPTFSDGTEPVRSKIGLIDGPGNTPGHLLAAAFAIDGILAQPYPGKRTYPPHRAGNVLVHCRAGKSRSVAAVALYFSLFKEGRFPSFERALDFVRDAAEAGPRQPSEALRELGRAAYALAIGMRAR